MVVPEQVTLGQEHVGRECRMLVLQSMGRVPVLSDLWAKIARVSPISVGLEVKVREKEGWSTDLMSVARDRIVKCRLYH